MFCYIVVCILLIPTSLQNLLDYRKNLQSVDIAYSQEIRNRTTKFSFLSANNGDVIYKQLGDQNGFIDINQDGTPTSMIPIYSLVTKEQTWQMKDNDFSAKLLPQKQKIDDIRTVGIIPGSIEKDIDYITGFLNKFQNIQEIEQNGKFIVIAQEKTTTIQWTINPNKDFNAENIIIKSNDKILSETKIELQNYNNKWFPIHIDKYSNSQQLISSIKIESAKLNCNTQNFSPTDIGIDSGTVIVDYKTNQQNIWNGSKPIPPEEYKNGLISGMYKRSNRMQLICDSKDNGTYFDPDMDLMISNSFSINRAKSYLGKWDRYTINFIQSHKLNDPKTTQANQILLHCKSEALRYIDSHKDKFDSITAEIKTTTDAKKAIEKFNKLLEPLDSIFETQLKPKLSELL